MRFCNILLAFFLILTIDLNAETQIGGGSVSGNWTEDGNPYYINGNIRIKDSDQLSIAPGVEIVFTGNYKFKIDGELLLQGTCSDPVIITSEDEDEYWAGFYFRTGSSQTSVIDNLISYNSAKGIKIQDSSPTISNSNFYLEQGSGLQVSGKALNITGESAAVVDNCQFLGYKKGISISNDSDIETQPVITNTRIRNSTENERGNCRGFRINGLVSVQIDNCDIEGYDRGLIFYNSHDQICTNPSLTNTRIRNSTEEERGQSIGIKVSGLVEIDIDDCLIEGFEKGINLRNQHESQILAPQITNVYIINDQESDRGNCTGIILEGLLSVLMDNCELSFYPKGITLENDNRYFNPETVIQNSRIRNSEENERAITTGLKLTGYISLLVNNCDIDFFERGIYLSIGTFNDVSTPVITNTRVRNSNEDERPDCHGLIVEKYKYLEVNDCDIEGYDTGMKFINEDECYTSEPDMINSRIRINPEQEGGSRGLFFLGNISPFIEYCDILGYEKAIEIENSCGLFTTSELKSSLISFCYEDGRPATFGVDIQGPVNFLIDDCDVLDYETGIRASNSYSQLVSNPELTNSRIRNSTEEERAVSCGIKIEDFIDPLIHNCEIEDYEVGILIENSNRDGSSTNPAITNSRVRNNPDTSRDAAIGMQISGPVNPRIEDCDLEYLNQAAVITNSEETDDLTQPVITNNRVRNGTETERFSRVGFYLNGNIDASFFDNIFVNCDPALEISGSSTTACFDYNLVYLEEEQTGWVAISAEDSQYLGLNNNTIAFYDYGIVSETASVEVNSNIIWKYNASEEPVSLNPGISVSYSNVGRPGGLIYPGLENINQDPFFGGGGRDFCFELSPESPCIDSGDPLLPPDPDGTIVDMGKLPYLQDRSQKIQYEDHWEPGKLRNYPNPFNPSTTISFSVTEETGIRIIVLNVKGQLICVLSDKNYLPGSYNLTWNGTDKNGKEVESGIYLIKMKSSGFEQIIKAMLMK